MPSHRCIGRSGGWEGGGGGGSLRDCFCNGDALLGINLELSRMSEN